MELIKIFKHDILTPLEVIDEAIKRKLSPPYNDEDYIKKNFSKLVMDIHDDAYDIYLQAEENVGKIALRKALERKIKSTSSVNQVMDEAANMFKELALRRFMWVDFNPRVLLQPCLSRLF